MLYQVCFIYRLQRRCFGQSNSDVGNCADVAVGGGGGSTTTAWTTDHERSGIKFRACKGGMLGVMAVGMAMGSMH